MVDLWRFSVHVVVVLDFFFRFSSCWVGTLWLGLVIAFYFIFQWEAWDLGFCDVVEMDIKFVEGGSMLIVWINVGSCRLHQLVVSKTGVGLESVLSWWALRCGGRHFISLVLCWVDFQAQVVLCVFGWVCFWLGVFFFAIG